MRTYVHIVSPSPVRHCHVITRTAHAQLHRGDHVMRMSVRRREHVNSRARRVINTNINIHKWNKNTKDNRNKRKVNGLKTCVVDGCYSRGEAHTAHGKGERLISISSAHNSNISERKLVQVFGGVIDNSLLPRSIVHPAVVLDHLNTLRAGFGVRAEFDPFVGEKSECVGGASLHVLVGRGVLAVVCDVLVSGSHADDKVAPLGTSDWVLDL